jgi:hypothetical protein
MNEKIEAGFMVFLTDGAEGIGAVRSVSGGTMTIYIENAGEFAVPIAAVRGVHSQKVMLDAGRLDKRFLDAVGHVHDSEDPKLAG